LIALVEPSVERSGTSASCQCVLQVAQYTVIQHRSAWEVTESVIARGEKKVNMDVCLNSDWLRRQG